ncbi:MAG: FAD-dependent oxidoreductase [Actinomycetota bacterium]|nr:FAD-dependent oxidoreductase [Actinomycetota bacterium]
MSNAPPRPSYDVVVVEASSGGVGAAVAAARAGRSVLLVEPTSRVGGMMTNGVTSDLLADDASTGLFDEHRALVEEAYAARGITGPEIRRGLYAEPEVALQAVRRLLDVPGLDVRTGWRLVSARAAGRVLTDVTLTDATLTGSRAEAVVRAGVFVDASPVGDLLAAVGERDVDWTVGREGRAVYGEGLAPEQGDDRQQAYTYRMVFQVGGRTDYAVPATYAEDLPRYRSVDRAAERLRCVVDGREYAGLRIQRCLPGGKFDINIDLVGANHNYPVAGPDERRAVEQRLMDFTVGWLHFLRTEAGHPELGLSRDDFPENGGLPVVLYVREGRRALGRVVFTEHDAAAGRVTHKPTAVAIGHYGLDSHCVGPAGGVSGGPECEGGFWAPADPFQVPYEVMLPAQFDNLLLPVPVSASHVGYSTLRMEPVRMNLGYAAGLAADEALAGRVPVARVDVGRLQRRLLEARQALVYTPGLDPRAPGFAELQAAQMHVLGAFSDVPATSPHVVGIAALHRAGIVQGRGDGTFRPADPVTRGQAASMVAQLAGLAPLTPGTLRDVSGPHAGAIEAVARAGLMSGYSDGTFRPGLLIRREQAASVLARLLRLQPVPDGPFPDVDGASTHGGSVNSLVRAGVVPPSPDRRFRPRDPLRRDEAASLLHGAQRSRAGIA